MTIAQITIEGPKPTQRKGSFLKANTTQAQNTPVIRALAGSGQAEEMLHAGAHLGDNIAGAALTSN